MNENTAVADIKSVGEILNKGEKPHRDLGEKLEFFPLSISLLSRITPILLRSKNMLSDYTPGGLLFGMHGLYSPTVCIRDDSLFISILSEDRMHREYLMPIGDEIESLELLDKYTSEHNFPLVIYGTSKNAEIAARHFRCGYELSDELCDYVYDAHTLASLEGSRYHNQRTNIRRLQREHESWRYERLDESNLPDAVEFARRLFSEDKGDGSKYWQAGVDIVFDSLSNLASLSLVGGILYVDGRAAGVAVGSVKHGMLYIHVLRADREIWGAWNLLCYEFVRDNIDTIQYVNMEDDLGDEGIRRMKLSYGPIDFIKRAKTTVR